MKSTGKPPAEVAIAVGLIRSGERFLVARRRPGSHLAGSWEFPGGKIQPGEEPAAALRREVAEEVGVTFRDAVLVHVEEHSYPERTVRLYFFLCLDPEGEPRGEEGQEIRWATVPELEELETPAANRGILRLLREQFAEA